jgi:hypothetical protein
MFSDPTITRNREFSLYFSYVIHIVKRQLKYIKLHIESDSEGRSRPKQYDNRYGFNFPIVNFSFTCSNIPAAPAYRVYYIFQLLFHSMCFLS